VVGGAGSELTKTIIPAVSRWQFIPAKGPDGKPAAVQMFLDMGVGAWLVHCSKQ
jgi:hypothetical protein